MELSVFLIPVLVFLTVGVLVIAVFEVLGRFNNSGNKLQEEPEVKVEYKSNVVLLSKAELQSYDLLKAALKNRNMLLLAKVRLVDLVKPIVDEDHLPMTKKEVMDKFVDLVAVDRKSGRIALAVEIIDSSAERKDLKFISQALEKAAIPFLSVSSNHLSSSDFKLEIDKILS
jgi:hypothetical protein